MLDVVLEVEESVSALPVLFTERHEETLELRIGDNLLLIVGILKIVLTDVSGDVLGDYGASKEASLLLSEKGAKLIADKNGACDTAQSSASSVTTGALL